MLSPIWRQRWPRRIQKICGSEWWRLARRGGKSRSPLEPHADWLLQITRAQPDLTLEAIVAKCEKEIGIETSEASLRRLFKRHAARWHRS
ncbi:protein of unknown function [Methylocella tundrae]|uniref:Transposase n=1 Tax=Methylocella tundrae TaxID=227605 RepID=A0A4U8YYB8_METTU|nr:protein of unknown function [Methylocella tundrae]